MMKYYKNIHKSKTTKFFARYYRINNKNIEYYMQNKTWSKSKRSNQRFYANVRYKNFIELSEEEMFLEML